jgi:hypothetical protein
MESSKEKTCRERINDHMMGREEFIESLYDAIDNQTEHEEVIDPYEFLMSEFALDVEKMISFKILLSTGGPGDWLMVTCDQDYYINSVDYHFNDWFDHAQVNVSRDSALWRYAEEIVEAMSYS